MSAIYDALVRLNDKVIALELAAELPVKKVQVLQQQVQDKKRAGKAREPDLFSIAAPANKNTGFDTSVLARKLDKAIEKVEQVLREG